jgi:CRP-like cAMP-binding protein
MKKLDVLRGCDLFRGLNDEQLGLVEKLCTDEVFEPGACLGKQGCKQNKVFIVEEGTVAIILEVGPLSQRQVQAASRFDVVCWSGGVEPNICTATSRAIEKTKVLAFHGEELCQLCLTHPNVGCVVCRGMARVIAGRLRQAYVQLLGVTSQD